MNDIRVIPGDSGKKSVEKKSLRESAISHLTIMERLLDDKDFPIVCTLSY